MPTLLQNSKPSSKTCSRPTIRLAYPDEGQQVHALWQAAKLPTISGIDWSLIYGNNWLVAETDTLVGCVMVQYGIPFGRMEYLIVQPGISKRLRSLVVRDLVYAGLERLSQYGSQAIYFGSLDTDTAWHRVVERRGAVLIGTGKFYLKKV